MKPVCRETPAAAAQEKCPAGLEVDQQQKILLLLTGSSCTSCLVGESRSCSSLNLQSALHLIRGLNLLSVTSRTQNHLQGSALVLLRPCCVGSVCLILQVFGLRDERRRTSTPRTSCVWRKPEPLRPVHLSVVLDLARRSKPEQQQQDSQCPIFSPVTLTVTFLQSLSAIKDVIASRILAHSSERVLTFDPDIVPLGL